MKLKKGDTVKVLSGKDRGKIGKIISILRDRNKVIVEKMNIVKKHKRQTGDQKDMGGIIEMEAPLSISKIMLLCPLCSKSTRVGYKLVKGRKERFCKKCKKNLT